MIHFRETGFVNKLDLLLQKPVLRICFDVFGTVMIFYLGHYQFQLGNTFKHGIIGTDSIALIYKSKCGFDSISARINFTLSFG